MQRVHLLLRCRSRQCCKPPLQQSGRSELCDHPLPEKDEKKKIRKQHSILPLSSPWDLKNTSIFGLWMKKIRRFTIRSITRSFLRVTSVPKRRKYSTNRFKEKNAAKPCYYWLCRTFCSIQLSKTGSYHKNTFLFNYFRLRN